jgi:hypothetical protein
LAEKKTICAGKTSGKANIEKPSGIRLKTKSRRFKIGHQRIIELDKKKKPLLKKTFLIISDVLHSQIFEEKSSRILYFISCQECGLQLHYL